MYRNLILPASILAGTIIGAGVFSLPFVFNEIGVLTGLAYLLIFAIFYTALYFIYADLILKTSGDHRFVGYAKLYLGKSGFWSAIFIGLTQLLFVLTIYLILAPSFIKLAIPNNYLYQLLIFWVLGSIIILFDTKKIALLEFLIVAGIIGIMLLVFIFGLKGEAFLTINWNRFDISIFRNFAVIGPILFSLSGALAIPEVVSYFREAKLSTVFLKRSLVLGGFLPAILYAVFVVGVLGLSPAVSEDAVSGLIGNVSNLILVLMGVLGFLSLFSSYIVVGLNARRIFEYDLGVPAWLSKALVIIIPITLYFGGFQSFLGLVSFVGLLFLPLEIVFIVLMWIRMRKSVILK